MTIQDYYIIADTLNLANVPANHKQYLAELFCDTLKAENPNFDRDKFITRVMDGIQTAICDTCGAPKGIQVLGESCNNNCGGKVVLV